MLEILILIFLVINVGKKAKRKGLDVIKWRVLTVVAWVLAEMLGLFIGIMLIGKDDLIKLMMIGIVSAFGGYLLIKYNLDKYPDIDDDINNIGR